MLKDVIFSTLESKGYEYKKSGEDFILSSCLNPKHKDKHPSFSVNLKTGYGFCFTCGYTVGKTFWLSDIKDADEYDELIREAMYYALLDNDKDENSSKSLVVLPPKSSDVSDGWRGLSSDIIKEFELYITNVGKYANRVIFPFKDDEGFRGFNSRALSSDMTPKYLYSTGTNLKNLIYPYRKQYVDELVVVEGVMDSLSLLQDNIPAIANLGLSVNFDDDKISRMLKLGVSKLWLMFDNDEAGKNAYKKFFDSKLADVFELDYAYNNKKLKAFYRSKCKDYNDYLQLKKQK